MNPKNRASLASLLLLIAAPFGCSSKEPAAPDVVAGPPPIAVPDADAVPPAPPLPPPMTDPMIRPASADPVALGERKVEAEARVVAGEVRGDAKRVVRDSGESVDQVKDEARKMIERARRDAAAKGKAAEDEVQKDVDAARKDVVEGLLGNPK